MQMPEVVFELLINTVKNLMLGVGVHQGSVISPLLFIIVLEALSRSFKSGCPYELLYADDLAIIVSFEEELLLQIKKWKDDMESKGLRVNMKKTKIMISGLNLGTLKDSGRFSTLQYRNICLLRN